MVPRETPHYRTNQDGQYLLINYDQLINLTRDAYREGHRDGWTKALQAHRTPQDGLGTDRR